MHSILRACVFTAFLSSVVIGWIAGVDKQLIAKDGTNLFISDSAASLFRRALSRPSLPSKVRGVSLGCLFVFEPWMAEDEWNKMGCGESKSEFNCVQKLGQNEANSAFQNHWNTWITQADIRNITSLGLNMVRIPVGFWMMESLVYETEFFPQGGLQYLEQFCGWASDAGLFIVIDMHGAPGAQQTDNSYTGQYVPTANFYNSAQYDRGTQFLSWLTNLIYTNNSFRNVGILNIVNEPTRNETLAATMIESYYPAAYSAIRAVETTLQIPKSHSLHIQLMNAAWGSGDPNTNLSSSSASNLAYDDHRYFNHDTSVAVTQSAYLNDSCKNPLQTSSLDKETPTIVGEFSLAVAQNATDGLDWNTSNTAFYTQWFAAQITGYERHTMGWIFWSWKTQLDDYRWDFQNAVAAGVVPSGLKVDKSVCSGGATFEVGYLQLVMCFSMWAAFWWCY